MKNVKSNQRLSLIMYNNDAVSCNHKNIDVSNFGILTCLNCLQQVSHFKGILESETQKRIRIDVMNNCND